MPKAPPKTTPTSECPLSDDLTDLRETLDRLSQTVQVLAQAVDEVSDELQWQNNGLRDRSIPRSPPFVLHDMPLDPTDPNWKINCRARRRVEARSETAGSASGSSVSPSPTSSCARGAARMLIDTEDGRCRACDGQLEIVNADDNALHVECLACGQAQSAEPGTFGDEALSYYYGFAAGREHPAEPQTTGSSGGTRAIDQLCKELADLRQIVAAFMLLVLEGADDLAVEIHDAVYAWANQEFDPEILKESLAETLCSTAGGIEKRPAAQKGLFSTDEPEAADGD